MTKSEFPGEYPPGDDPRRQPTADRAPIERSLQHSNVPTRFAAYPDETDSTDRPAIQNRAARGRNSAARGGIVCARVIMVG